MSTEQENFDDLLKSRLDENEFAFNETNWDKAETLIIQAEKKRKRRIIGFIFFIGLLLGICVMIPFIGGENDTEKKVSNKKNIKSDNKAESEVKSENISRSSNKATKTDENEKVIKENEQIVSSSNNVLYENGSKEVNLKKEKAVIAGSYSSKKQKNNSSDAVFTETKKNKGSIDKEQKGRSESYKKNDAQSLIKENQITEIAVVNNNKKEVKTTKTEETKNTVSGKNEKLNVAPPVLDSTRDVILANNNLKKDTIIAKDSVVKTKVDSVKPIAKETTEIFKKLTIFSIDAGANYAFGWANNTTKEANGFNAVLGISAIRQFTKKWSILVGIQYNSLAHLNYSNYTSSNLQYDLGYNQTKTVITPTMLYYMAVPIKLQYNFNEKNSLSIGVNALYLLNTSSKVETYTESTFGAPIYKTSTKKGYMDGFSTWDLQPSFAYRRRIVKCLSINAEAYYGLMDIKKNGVFGPVKSEHNSGLKLTLSYNFLHK